VAGNRILAWGPGVQPADGRGRRGGSRRRGRRSCPRSRGPARGRARRRQPLRPLRPLRPDVRGLGADFV